MKLKKIASLMLAGVMAVGMLTACGGNANSNNGGASSDDTTTTRGYSDVLGDALKDFDAVKDKDYITFQDNSADETALKGALNNLSESSLKTLAGHATVWSIDNSNLADVKEVADAFVDAAKINDPTKDLKVGDIAMDWYAGYRDGSTTMVNTGAKDGTLYVVNGAVGVNEAVKQVAEKLKTEELSGANALPEESASAKVASSNSGNASYKYEYVISVSVAEKALDSTYTGAANSAIFIAVTVTRTVVDGI